MKLCTCVFAGAALTVALSMLGIAAEKRAVDSANAVSDDYADLRSLLRKGRSSDALPAGVVLRVETQLSKSVPVDEARLPEAGPQGREAGTSLRETWEFSADQVHRVATENPKDQNARGKRIYRRIESKPYEPKGICKELLDADIFALADRQGEGPVHFAGTGCDIGHRQISILLNGSEAFSVGESCAVAGFAQDDAEAFAALHNKLAARGRNAFKKH